MYGKNFIIDFETLGTDIVNGFPVVDCSYMTFDADRFTSDNPYTYEELLDSMQKIKFDVEDYCTRFGYKPSKSTLQWWSTQPPEARKQLKPLPSDLTVEEFADKLVGYLQNNKPNFWWSRGNTFDPLVIYRIFDDINRTDEFAKLCKFWALRDIRTYIDAKFDFNPKINNGFVVDEWKDKFVKHDSRHDVTVDILRLQLIIRTNNED